MTSVSRNITISSIIPEVKVLTSRSGGSGGQHVNKVETRVQVIFNIDNSQILNDEQKKILRTKYSQKINKEGSLIVSCDKKRSQLKNKEIAYKKLERLLNKALEPVKPRVKSKPSKASIQKRLKDKKILSEKKAIRRKKMDD